GTAIPAPKDSGPASISASDGVTSRPGWPSGSPTRTDRGPHSSPPRRLLEVAGPLHRPQPTGTIQDLPPQGRRRTLPGPGRVPETTGRLDRPRPLGNAVHGLGKGLAHDAGPPQAEDLRRLRVGPPRPHPPSIRADPVGPHRRALDRRMDRRSEGIRTLGLTDAAVPQRSVSSPKGGGPGAVPAGQPGRRSRS